MHSSVLVSQHHHHQLPSLNRFSINLIPLQPDSNLERKIMKFMTSIDNITQFKKLFLANIPLHIAAMRQYRAPLKWKLVAPVQLEIHQ